MSKHCEYCPVDPEKSCLGVDAPEVFGHYCSLAEAGKPIDLKMIVGRSAIGPTDGPGLARKLRNLAAATAGHVAAGLPAASDEVRTARLAICREDRCGLYLAGDRCRHPECGCYLAVKVGWAEQSCPLTPPLWGPVELAK